MCLECLHTPCHPRCPNAPDPQEGKGEYKMKWCYWSDEGD